MRILTLLKNCFVAAKKSRSAMTGVKGHNTLASRVKALLNAHEQSKRSISPQTDIARRLRQRSNLQLRIAVIFTTLLTTGFLFTSCIESPVPGNTPQADSSAWTTSYIHDSVATVDALELHFYIPVNAYPTVATTRPLKSDSSVAFVCAAAFTLLDNGKIDGLFIENGNVKVNWVNHTLGGGIIIPDKSSGEKPVIFGTDMGKSLDSSFIDSVAALKASFFQQIQMVRNGEALVFRKDVSLFQRRALCMWHNELVVVETSFPCTLQKFADVLKSCGIQNALYVDMGSWDEGWFRTQHNAVTTIGLMRNQTDKQSNWFVFVAKD